MDTKRKMNMATSLKRNLQLHLERKGWTASQLARTSKVSKQKISNMLAGSVVRSFDDLKSISTALGLTSIDELVFGEPLAQKSQAPDAALLGDEQTYEIKVRRINSKGSV
ncbi:MAG: hypothetical protein A4S09_04875 [Proteobacteria bacterium SG_bin7]|nr:MAG: hypothetical protein A4S09_04875 [Proteobacteria bacterium SG_bin7]